MDDDFKWYALMTIGLFLSMGIVMSIENYLVQLI